MDKKVIRLNPHDDVDSWAKDFNERLLQAVDQPLKELPSPNAHFCDWRLSYGLQAEKPSTLYFLAFYPPFCVTPKARFHYTNLAELATDVMEMENYLTELPGGGPEGEANIEKSEGVDAQDIIACAFCILRDKESIELFEDQKDLMELGLKHYHLDNYYQDHIKTLCAEYYASKRILGKSFTVSLFKRAEDASAK